MGNVKMESINLRVSNASDENKTYDISCTVSMNGNDVTSVDGGQVTKDANPVADFSKYGHDNFNISFHGIAIEEQCVIITDVNTFIEDAIALVDTQDTIIN